LQGSVMSSAARLVAVTVEEARPATERSGSS